MEAEVEWLRDQIERLEVLRAKKSEDKKENAVKKFENSRNRVFDNAF